MTGFWDEELIRSIFISVDVDRIMQIPLNYGAFEDFITYHPDHKGFFSVKSAYKVQWIRSFQAHATVMARLGGSRTPAVWSTLWKQKVPRKIQKFCWRSLHGIIPLKSILTNHHIATNGACPICHQDAEDVCHLLFDCCNAKHLWECLGIAGSKVD